MLLRTFTLLTLTLACACRSPMPETTALAEVTACLDRWHLAAAQADGAAYFATLAKDAVFLGTDKTERWTKAEFQAYAEPYFARGQGWTYHPRDRHIELSTDGQLAWLDERLDNEKYGELRGTGVLRREGAEWRLVHYSMSFPIPNELTQEFVQRMRAVEKPQP